MTIPVGYTDESIVSVDELIKYMSNITLTDAQKIDAASTLLGVQNELEVYLNRPIQPLHVREARASDSSGYINLSASPIHKIIKTDMVETLFQPDPFFTPPVLSPLTPQEGIYRVSLDYARQPNFGDPLVVPGGMYIGYPNAWYVVEYIGGYIGYYDEALKQAIKRVAAREVQMNHDDTLSLRDDSATEGRSRDQRDLGWTEYELKKLDRLRRRTISR